MNVAVFVGGVNVSRDRTRLAQGSISVLVSTPGRLIDHLQNTHGFAKTLSHVNVVILDEADRLLDMGFKPDIERILSFLPPTNKRQTLLFSATVPPSITAIAKDALNPNYVRLDTTGLASDDSGSTHMHVHQDMLCTGLSETIPAIGAVIRQEIESSRAQGYKIIVFFPTARTTAYMASVFSAAGLNVVEIHSRKSQAYRATNFATTTI